jgi:DNA-binding NtrC family response regulator
MAQPVLIADDDTVALDGLRALLCAWGFEVYTATDGVTALERAMAISPAAVITDVVMPLMGGLELLVRLRLTQPDTPVIVVTGQGDETMLVHAIRQGAYAYLSKPVDVRQLRALLQSALGKERAHRTEGANAAN